MGKLNGELTELETLIQQQQFDVVKDKINLLFDDEENKKSIELQLLMGHTYIGLGDDDAPYYFRRALDLDETCIEALFSLGNISKVLGDNFDALEYYQKVLTLAPDNLEATRSIGDIHCLTKNFNAGIDQYNKVIELGIKEKITLDDYVLFVRDAVLAYLNAGKYVEALGFMVKHKPKDFSEELELTEWKIYQEAIRTEFVSRPQVAQNLIRISRKLEAYVPENVSYKIQLAELLYENMDFDTALIEWKYGGKITEVEGIYKESLDMDISQEDKILILQKRVDLLRRFEKWEDSIVDLDELLALEKENSFFYQFRAEAKLNIKDAKGAIKDIANAIKLAKNERPSAFKLRGDIYVMAKAFDKAIEDYKKHLELAFDKAEAYFILGRCYHKKKDAKNAVKMFLKAESLGHLEAKSFLENKFLKQLKLTHERTSSKVAKLYEGQANRNASSPILSQTFGKLWTPNMDKVMQVLGEEIVQIPAKILTTMLDKVQEQLLLITNEGILFFEMGRPAEEYYYKVLAESTENVVLQLQSVKGTPTQNMRLKFYKDLLIVSFPIEEDGPDPKPKYFKVVEKANEQQVAKLNDRVLDYMDSIEEAIKLVTN
ncbi:MAG: tetratricopeptide repeat protein [Saprospiraceae bacterium]|nr:tetratricopeptide repeat protein [Saprospiraceae bacterium]